MKKIFTLIAVLACALGVQAAEETWTIAGDKALMGVHWDPTATENLMSTTDGTTFTLTKQNVMLKADKYEYKACANGGWDTAVPQSGNMELMIEADGAYTVVFTLANATDPDSRVLSAVPTKTGEYEGPTEDTWIVAGAEDLMGSNWNGADENNKMTTADGKIYKLTKTQVPMNIDTPYEYKFVQNESAWYGDLEGIVSKENGNKNFQIFVTEPGLYTVEWTLNTETWTQQIQTTKTGEHEFGEKTWTICGVPDLCGAEWDPSYTDNDMEKVDEGVFELTRYSLALVNKDYEYKVAANHSWGESYGNESGQNQVLTVAAEGTYDVTFSFIVSTKTLSAEYAEATAIEKVTVKALPAATLYNLQGQRVSGNYRGLVIRNGVKVVLK